MFKKNEVEGTSDIRGLFRNVPGYAVLASLWVFVSHFVFDILLGSNPDHQKYETVADLLVAVPTTLIVFLLLRRELLSRKQTEKDRAATERRLTHILQNANDAIIGVDEGHQIFLFNRGAELIFGYDRTEVCGRPLQTLLPARLQYPHSSGREGRPIETTARRRDGTVFPAEISLSRLEEEGRAFLTIVLRDVTQRKAAEAALQRSNQELETRVEERTNELRVERERLTRILDALPDGISVITQDGQIEYLNPALERDFGPIDGRRCHAYLHEECEECVDCPGGAGHARDIVTGEWHSSRTGKTYERMRVPLASSNGPVARLEILHDISRRRAAEKERERLRAELDAHRHLFQTIVQNATVGIAVFDGTELRLKWLNPVYREFLDERFRNADLTGMRLEEIVPQAAEVGLTGLFRAVATSGKPHSDPEFRYTGFKRGITYWQWSLLPMPASGKAVPDLMVLANEITALVNQRKRVEELRAEAERRADELRHAYNELEQRSRELSAVLDFSREATSTLDLHRRFEIILEQLQTTFECDGAAVLLQDQGKLTVAAHRGLLPEEPTPGMSATLKRALCFEQALAGSEPLIVRDLWSESVMAQEARESREVSSREHSSVSRSWMSVPMLIKDRVVGLLRLEHSQPGYFKERHAQLALTMANHAALAIENARLYREARKLAALEERQRLARDLHDSVSQALYAIALATHTGKEILGQNPDRLRETLDQVLALAESATSEMRFLIFELRPEYLENEALSTTLARLADAVRGRYGCDVRIDLRPETNIPPDLKETLYRICHEALTNTARHARAGVAIIRIREENGGVVLVVEDDGIGFDPGASFPGHLGLQSMRERAAELGGVLEIESGPGKGTLVRARFPRAAGASQNT